MNTTTAIQCEQYSLGTDRRIHRCTRAADWYLVDSTDRGVCDSHRRPFYDTRRVTA